MKSVIINLLYVLVMIVILGLGIVSSIPSPLKAEKEPCVRCSEIGCYGGTDLCAQFVCRGTLVQCFTRGGFGS